MAGSLSSKGVVGGVLRAGRSKACSIDGRRKESLAWGRGRIDVASAEAVMELRAEKRVALLVDVTAEREELLVRGLGVFAKKKGRRSN